MTLTTHAVAGAAVAIAFRAHPAWGLLIACASHFALDAIPHWDHPLRSRSEDKNDHMNDRLSFWTKEFYRDVFASGFDGALGIALVAIMALWYAPHRAVLALAGAAASMFPDLLQVVYYGFPQSSMKYLQRFHRWAHAKTDFNNRPWVGVPLQVTLIGIILLLVSRI